MKLSFPHLEYQIKRDPLTGYEDSAWLRLLTPLTEEDPCVEVDLCADLGIPHPLKLFPDGVRILSQSYDTDDSPLLKYRYMVRLAGKLYEQQVVCLELSFGRETVCACAGGRDLFDILAEYDRRREEILRLAADGGSGAGEAYAQMEAFAREFASAMEVPLPESGRTGRGAGSPLERGGRAGRGSILLKLCAAFGGEASLTVEIDDESRRVMEELGIALDHAEIASGGAGEDGVVEVRLSGLPIYECTCVRPCAWVIQNENLFSPAKFPVNPAFLFRTQESSADVLRVRAEYGKREFRGDTDFARAAAAVWELLELNRTASAPSVAVSLCYGIAASGTVLPLRLPAVFLPQAPSPGAVSDALARWSRSAGRGGKPLEVVFQVDVYGAEGYDALMSAEVVVTG